MVVVVAVVAVVVVVVVVAAAAVVVARVIYIEISINLFRLLVQITVELPFFVYL